jgi:dihydropteroate synthase
MGPRPHVSFWQTTRFKLDLTRPLIMGIVNVTPDSFYDAGRFAGVESAVAHAQSLLDQGADILDIGGESTRPGALPVDDDEEWQRIGEVIGELTRWHVPISVDSYRFATQKRALDRGVDIINDVWALQREGGQQILRDYGCGVCLMHMQGEPQTMQRAPIERDALGTVEAFFLERLQWCESLHTARERIVLDPGIGFGKTVEQNLLLLKYQTRFLEMGYPLLVGWSRKSTLGALTQLAPEERLIPSVAAMVMCLDRGAKIMRVHDVQESVSALKVWQAVQDASLEEFSRPVKS